MDKKAATSLADWLDQVPPKTVLEGLDRDHSTNSTRDKKNLLKKAEAIDRIAELMGVTITISIDQSSDCRVSGVG